MRDSEGEEEAERKRGLGYRRPGLGAQVGEADLARRRAVAHGSQSSAWNGSLARLDRRPSDVLRATCLEGKFPLPWGWVVVSCQLLCAGPGLDGWAHRVVLLCLIQRILGVCSPWHALCDPNDMVVLRK